MLSPIHTPLAAEDRIAGLLIHLESAAAPSMTLTPLAVRRIGSVEALVIVTLGDRGREPLTASEARLMSRCLRDDAGEATGEGGRVAQATRWAADLDAAAEAAELAASTVFLLPRGNVHPLLRRRP